MAAVVGDAKVVVDHGSDVVHRELRCEIRGLKDAFQAEISLLITTRLTDLGDPRVCVE